jgi:hypothetical protein
MTICNEKILKIIIDTLSKMFLVFIFMLYISVLNTITYSIVSDNCLNMNYKQINTLKQSVTLLWICIIVFILIWLYKVSSDFTYYLCNYKIFDTVILLIIPILLSIPLWELNRTLMNIKTDSCDNGTKIVEFCFNPYNNKLYVVDVILLWIFTVIGILLVLKKILNPKVEEKYIDLNIKELQEDELILDKNCNNVEKEIDYMRCRTRNKNIKIKECVKKVKENNRQRIREEVMKNLCE